MQAENRRIGSMSDISIRKRHGDKIQAQKGKFGSVSVKKDHSGKLQAENRRIGSMSDISIRRRHGDKNTGPKKES